MTSSITIYKCLPLKHFQKKREGKVAITFHRCTNVPSLAAQQQQSGGWKGAGPLHPSPGALTAPRHRAACLTVHARHQAHHHIHGR